MKPSSAAVLSYMKKYGSVTPIEALKHCGTMRLGARIFDLREDGYRIKSRLVSVRTRNGTARVARYTLA